MKGNKFDLHYQRFIKPDCQTVNPHDPAPYFTSNAWPAGVIYKKNAYSLIFLKELIITKTEQHKLYSKWWRTWEGIFLSYLRAPFSNNTSGAPYSRKALIKNKKYSIKIANKQKPHEVEKNILTLRKTFFHAHLLSSLSRRSSRSCVSTLTLFRKETKTCFFIVSVERDKKHIKCKSQPSPLAFSHAPLSARNLGKSGWASSVTSRLTVGSRLLVPSRKRQGTKLGHSVLIASCFYNSKNVTVA